MVVVLVGRELQVQRRSWASVVEKENAEVEGASACVAKYAVATHAMSTC